MKKYIMAAMAVLVVALVAVPAAFSYPVSAGQDIWIGRVGTVGGGDGGGEFSIHSGVPTAANKLFESFCVEKDEYISIGGKFHIDTIQDDVVQGGVGGPSPDPLDSKTKYLFYMFTAGTLAGYTNDNTSANALQNAIWYLEQEIPTLAAGLATTFYNNAAAATLNDPNGVWNNKVKAMNLVTIIPGTETVLNQSLLVAVPEPSTLLLLGAGLLGMGFMVRRRKK